MLERYHPMCIRIEATIIVGWAGTNDRWMGWNERMKKICWIILAEGWLAISIG